MLGRLGGAHLDRYADLFDDDLYADRLDIDGRAAREISWTVCGLTAPMSIRGDHVPMRRGPLRLRSQG